MVLQYVKSSSVNHNVSKHPFQDEPLEKILVKNNIIGEVSFSEKDLSAWADR